MNQEYLEFSLSSVIILRSIKVDLNTILFNQLRMPPILLLDNTINIQHNKGMCPSKVMMITKEVGDHLPKATRKSLTIYLKIRRMREIKPLSRIARNQALAKNQYMYHKLNNTKMLLRDMINQHTNLNNHSHQQILLHHQTNRKLLTLGATLMWNSINS
jgi:hypothetical protein